MFSGHIEREHRLSDTESVVKMRLVDANLTITHCIGIVVHPDDKPVSFRAVERVVENDPDAVFNRRTMFNCRMADTVVRRENLLDLKPHQVCL